MILSAHGIYKSFSGVAALKNVRLQLRAGEVHALMGENGAGKSTLIKILTGFYPLDAGEIELAGEKIPPPKSVGHAQALGISTVYQEVNLIPTLSVAENIFLGREPRSFGRIRWSAVHAGAEKALERLGIRIDVRKPLGDYSIAIQQMTAIARAVDTNARVLILDEATSSLDANEVQSLFAVIRKLKQDGMAILFVTHFLDQVYDVSDRITVLRNGQFVGEYLTAQLPRFELVANMMGQELAQNTFGDKANAVLSKAEAPAWLECEDVGRKGSIRPFSLRVRAGERLGLAGLLGSGRTEIARLLFGLDPSDQGRIKIDGKVVTIKNPRAAIRHGFALAPEDRKAQGIFPQLSVRENIILALQIKRGWFRALTRKKQNEIADKYIKAFRIRARDAEQPIQTLSGGNQQKAILARWMVTDPRLLILDEPTRGIDVGAKREIQNIVDELAQSGRSVMFISSELEEVVRCADRVAILKDKSKVGEISGAQISEKKIMSVIAGDAR
jgi:monosaccharide-transporting ATPase